MFRILIILSTIVVANSKTITIAGTTWKNEVKSCASDGGYDHEYKFYLGKLENYGVSYKDISGKISAVAYGDLQLRTGKTGWIPESKLTLNDYKESENWKQVKGKWHLDATRGWGAQTVEMVLKLYVYDTGAIYLGSYVYAGSWWSVTCAETKAYVEQVKLSMETY